jgi:hypothetical protein
MSQKSGQIPNGGRLGLILGWGGFLLGDLFYWLLAVYSPELRRQWWWITPALGALVTWLLVSLLAWSGWDILETDETEVRRRPFRAGPRKKARNKRSPKG